MQKIFISPAVTQICANPLMDLPVRGILCEAAPEDLYCGQCNTGLKPLGKEVVREELDNLMPWSKTVQAECK